ncbi:amidohydrolase family protein [Catenulispora sp. NF23]|uniref:amidohydrolase family protein n=1 Tax=Catenulispora pinistramenti TaxID=2705254 RepID=UPI001BA75B04|nr:amidohydrolase family protein [Catenulispora pinistramenti]MBS2539157.1 amidohydrolase family protein [Catenulispora pinistramenti]
MSLPCTPFYTPGTVVRDLLPFLTEFEDVFVIDHMGYMKASDGLTAEPFQGLIEVLHHGYGHIKLSGPYRVAPGQPRSATGPLGRALVGARSDRLVWGSDWPHLPDGQRDTGELLDLLADWAPRCRGPAPDPGRDAGPALLRTLTLHHTLKGRSPCRRSW